MNDFAKKILTAPLGKTHLFSVGQAGFIIKSKTGILIGIDLYLSNCVERVEGHIGFKRLLPQLLSSHDIVFDYLISTHVHSDHFDMDSIPELLSNNHTVLFASQKCKPEIIRLQCGNERIKYISPEDSFYFDDIMFHFVKCDHGNSAPDAVGVVVSVDGFKFLEIGDSSLHLDWASYYLDNGSIDYLIGPINGAYGNMNEYELVKLYEAINPRFVIPCHYGMFASHGGNPGIFLDEMKKKKALEHVLILGMGEKIVVS